MTPRLPTTLVLLLASSAAAQHVTTPPGFVDKEGNTNMTFGLGSYADGRFQYADGHHRGKAMVLKGVAYRPGNYAYGPTTGMGRSFTKVTLDVSQCDIASFGRTFANNPTSTPTRVFDAAVTWPTLSGKPSNFPANWSIQFPFTSNWSYDGSGDLCLDYQFSGGTLANSATWSGATNRPYYMDSHSYATQITTDSTSLGDFGANIGCNDRSVTHVNGAQTWSRATIYSNDYPTATLRNKIVFQQDGRYFAASRPAMTFIGFKSLRNGFFLPGLTCNAVHIDFSLPTFQIPSFTNASGNLVSLNLSTTNPGLGGAELVSQVLWTDAMTRNPLLSNAATMTLPDTPPSMPTTLLYYHIPANATGNLSASRSYQPVVRYSN